MTAALTPSEARPPSVMSVVTVFDPSCISTSLDQGANVWPTIFIGEPGSRVLLSLATDEVVEALRDACNRILGESNITPDIALAPDVVSAAELAEQPTPLEMLKLIGSARTIADVEGLRAAAIATRNQHVYAALGQRRTEIRLAAALT